MTALRTARRSSLVAQVIDQLRAQIASGEWPIGRRIPTEPELAASFDVGRNTVREAVRALCHAGMLECRQGDGTYVRATSELSGLLRGRLGRAELIETLEVRQALESSAAALAAARHDDRDREVLRRSLATRELAWRRRDRRAFVDADSAFHVAVVTAAHNTMLADLYGGLSEALRASIAATGSPIEDGYIDHAAILDAVLARAPHAAEAAVRDCMTRIMATVDAQAARDGDQSPLNRR